MWTCNWEFKDGIKILGKGVENYNVPLNIEASRASDIAIQAIEKQVILLQQDISQDWV